MNPVALYFAYGSLSLKALFAFRIDAVLRTLAVFVREFASVIVVYLILQRFPDLGGWNMNEVLFLFSFLFLTYAIMIALFTGFRDFDMIVNSGKLDLLLIRPRGTMFQLMAYNSDYLATLGHGAVGITLLVWSAQAVGIVWNPARVAFLLLTLVSGVLIQGAIFVAFSCLSLWFGKSGNVFRALYRNSRKIAGYPLSIFPDAVRSIVLYIMPFAFVNYFPAAWLLGKTDGFWPGLPFLSWLIGPLLFALAYVLWRFSLLRYSSTGH